MLEYIAAVKRGLRDHHGFNPLPGSTENEPLLDVPDGDYPMEINGRLDHVQIRNGKIHCCRWSV